MPNFGKGAATVLEAIKQKDVSQQSLQGIKNVRFRAGDKAWCEGHD